MRYSEHVAADEFEAKNMHDGSPIVHRDKKVSRGMTAALCIPALFVIALSVYIAVANGTASKPVPEAVLPLVCAGVAALGVFLGVIGLMFAVVRTIVTEEAVHVKYGLWGPDISLDAIKSCNVVEYDWTQFGGWGIRRGRDGTWAYVPASGPVVELRYVEEGKDKRVLVGAEDATETVRQIERARAARSRPRPASHAVRVAATPAATSDVEEAEEREADSELRGRRAE